MDVICNARHGCEKREICGAAKIHDHTQCEPCPFTATKFAHCSTPNALLVSCLRTDIMKHPVEGSMIVRCYACDTKVYISPATRALAGRKDPQERLVLCDLCTEEEIKRQKEEKDEVPGEKTEGR